jgi:hypothetical protein
MNLILLPPRRLASSLLVCAALGLGGLTATSQEGPPSERPMVRAAQLMEKAADLKAQGRHDEAMKLQREADELRARNLGPMRPDMDNRARELKDRREQLLKHLDELRQSGRNDEAAKAKEEIVGLERELGEIKRQGAGMRETPLREPGRPMPEGERRLQHLMIAIDNLHAAGFHKDADRLAKESERLRREAARQPNEAMSREMREMRKEIDRLREMVKNLERRAGPDRPAQKER